VPAPIKIKLTPRQRAVYLAPTVVCGLLGSVHPLFYAAAGGFFLGFLLVSTAAGVRLSEEGLTARYIRRRRIPWSSIRQVESTMLGTSRTVTIHYGEGKRKRLIAPTTNLMVPDDEFDLKLDGIREWWTHYAQRSGEEAGDVG
jgi:hypothetical protein